jgi:hypothetical protein
VEQEGAGPCIGWQEQGPMHVVLERHGSAVGAGVREHLMISKLSTYPTYTTIFLRAEYMWGW